MNKKRVLVVDDDEAIRGLVEDVLGQEDDYEVRALSNPSEALLALAHNDDEDNRFDLLLTDLNFGEGKLNGVDLAREVAAVRGKKFPVILMTGGEIHPEEAGLYIHRVIKKPFGPMALVATLRSILP